MAEPVRARRLTDQEGSRLQQIVRRGKHGSVRVRRAMIIMASASGTPVAAIARLVRAGSKHGRLSQIVAVSGAAPADHGVAGSQAGDDRWLGFLVFQCPFAGVHLGSLNAVIADGRNCGQP